MSMRGAVIERTAYYMLLLMYQDARSVTLSQRCAQVSMYKKRSNFFYIYVTLHFQLTWNNNCLGAKDGSMRITKICVLQCDCMMG